MRLHKGKKFTDAELRIIRDHPRLPYNVRKMAGDLLENKLNKRVREAQIKYAEMEAERRAGC